MKSLQEHNIGVVSLICKLEHQLIGKVFHQHPLIYTQLSH